MIYEGIVGVISAFLVTYFGMTVIAPSEVTEKEAEDITINEVEAKKSGNEAAIKEINSDSNKLIILFGWAGCKDRYLSKYSQYYKNESLSTIRFTAPITKIRSFASYRSFARSFNRILEETLKEHSIEHIYFHVFSMNGCSLLTAYWDQLNHFQCGAEIMEKSRGIIFDSCPAFTSPSQSAQAVSFATLPPSRFPGAVRESYRAVLYTFFSFHRGVLWLRSLVEKDVYERHYAYFKMLTFTNLPQKQLYIYGPADNVCSEDSIEKFALLMEKRGMQISKLRLLDSLHCQHLRSHPNIYTEECLEFIKFDHLPPNQSRVELENCAIEEEDKAIPAELNY